MADTTNNSGLLQVRLVTPDRILLDETATAVELPSMSGYLEALYGAAPLLAELGAGEGRPQRGSGRRADLLCGLGLRGSAAGACDDPGRNRAASGRDRSGGSAEGPAARAGTLEPGRRRAGEVRRGECRG